MFSALINLTLASGVSGLVNAGVKGILILFNTSSNFKLVHPGII
jgi:hypothetical protein